MQLDRLLIQTLESWRRAGVSELAQASEVQGLLEAAQVAPVTTARHAAPSTPAPTRLDAPSTSAATHLQSPPSKPSPSEPITKTSAPQETIVTKPSLPQTMNREERVSCLTEIAGRVAKCTKCKELADTRTQTVFGVGDPEATVMFIGEAPGADEDKQGEPFVGRAGKLLDKIIEACGWTREELYICNILRCRPPGNRNPSPIEADNCSEFLQAQIETVDPDYIVCWGTIAAQNVLNTKTPIGRMRGELFERGRARVLCTYHPSYLLRNPPAKKLVWEDLKILLAELGIDPDKK